MAEAKRLRALAEASRAEKSSKASAPSKEEDGLLTTDLHPAAKERPLVLPEDAPETEKKDTAEAPAPEGKRAEEKAKAERKPKEPHERPLKLPADNVTDIRIAKKRRKKKTYVMHKTAKREADPEAAPRKMHVAAFIALGLLLAAAGALIALYFVAEVETITVSGNSRFTETEIVNLSGLYTGKNLYLYELGEAKARIESNPYLECPAIHRVFPHELNIEVTEREEFLAIASTGGMYTVTDRNGFVLDVSRRASTEGLIPVYGFGSMGFATGTSIISDRTKLRPYTLMQIVEAVGERSGSIASIDLSNTASVRIITKDGTTVMLGDSVDVAEKIGYMFNALAKADAAGLSGAVIYINSNGTADISHPTPAPTAEPAVTDEPDDTDEPDETDTPDETGEPGGTDDPEVTDEP